MEKEPKSSPEMAAEAGPYSDTKFSYLNLDVTEENIIYFGQIINSYANEGLNKPLDGGKLIGLLNTYMQVPSEADQGSKVEKVINLLQGNVVTDPLILEETVKAVLEVARAIGQNVNKPELAYEMSSLFSFDRTEDLRAQINKYAGASLFSEPLLDEEVWAFVDVYARTHLKQRNALIQTKKLIAILQARSIKDIAREFNVKENTISDMWRKAVSNIALEFIKEINQPEMRSLFTVDQSVQTFLHEVGLPKSYSTALKKHLGGSQSPLTAEEIVTNIEVGNRIQEEIKRRVDYAEMAEEAIPSKESLQLIRTLLGSKRNGVFPVSRKSLVGRYHETLKYSRDNSLSDEAINDNISEYNSHIDSVLREVALWMHE